MLLHLTSTGLYPNVCLLKHVVTAHLLAPRPHDKSRRMKPQHPSPHTATAPKPVSFLVCQQYALCTLTTAKNETYAIIITFHDMP